MNTRQQRELERQADVVSDMRIIWSGKTKYFGEIIDTFGSAGISYQVNKKNWEIKVSKKDYDQANGILMELNAILDAGW